jgi:hypothetical protein
MSEIYCEAEELVKLLEETEYTNDTTLQNDISILIFDYYGFKFNTDLDIFIAVKIYDINEDSFKCKYVTNHSAYERYSYKDKDIFEVIYRDFYKPRPVHSVEDCDLYYVESYDHYTDFYIDKLNFTS